MSKQGKHQNKNNSRSSAEWQKEKMIQSSSERKLFSSSRGWSSSSTLQRIIIGVLVFSIVGVIFTLIFEEKEPVKTAVSVPMPVPESDITVQQGNKLTTVISKAEEYSSSVLPEITQAEIIDPEFTQEDIIETNDSKPFSYEDETKTTTNQETPLVSNQERWFSYTIEPGDTLAKIFRGQQLPLEDLYRIEAIEGTGKPVSKIVPNQEVRFRLNEAADLDALEIKQGNRYVVFVRTPQGSFIRQQ